MNAKRKPTKPVKAWAYVHVLDGDMDVQPSFFSRDRLRSDRPIIRPARWWRIARVEIREIGR